MAVFINGMHRSGTSVLARVTGLVVGYEAFRGEAHDNLEGHWEDPRVNFALDRALFAADADWASPPLVPLTAEQLSANPNQPANQRIWQQQLAPNAVVKDPRFCLALTAIMATPFGKEPLMIATFREPSEVARSISTRDGYEFEYGLALWEVYNNLLLRQLLDLPDRDRCLWVSYAALTTSPHSVAERIAAHADAAGLAVAAGAIETAGRAVNLRLRNHTSSDDGVSSLSESQGVLRSLLLELAEGSGAVSPSDVPAITPWAAALLNTRRPYARMERNNRLLQHRLRHLRWGYRLADSIRRSMGHAAPEDPFDDYSTAF